MKYVSVKFNELVDKTYTYEDWNEVAPVGAEVVVQTVKGLQIVYVVSVSEVKPAFECKQIVGLLVRDLAPF